ncbi:G2/M phase-specific E3 ubiquitin-protein ligase-like [Glandiceps talaboti]
MTSIIDHQAVFRDIFMYTNEKLTARCVEGVVDVSNSLSPEGSNKRAEELTVLSYWRDYLVDVEEGEAEVTLKALVVFATGLDGIPPLGFSPSPTLDFRRADGCGEGLKLLPIANTCANMPIVNSYDIFKDSLEFGILNSQGFCQV